MERNYKSDFNFILRLKTCVRNEDGTCSKQDVGWPDHDWVAVFWTASRANTYTASRKGDVLTNCINDGGRIRVVFKNHHLSCGTLNVEFQSKLPDNLYPDGIENLYDPQPLDIELVAGMGDCATDAEVEVMLPYIKGKDAYEYAVEHGYQGTADEFGQSLAMVSEKQNRLSVSDEMNLSDDGELSLTDKARHKVFIDLFNAACAVGDTVYGGYDPEGAPDAEHPFVLNRIRLTYPEAIDVYRACGQDRYLYFGDSPLYRYPYRAAFPVKVGSYYVNEYFCANARLLETLVIASQGVPYITLTEAFNGCVSLREIKGQFSARGNYRFAFKDCRELREVRLNRVEQNISFADSPYLSLASISHMVATAANQSAITITVHPDVYARLTDSSDTDWHKVLADAISKNISFATV